MASLDGIESMLVIESLLRQAIGLDVQSVGRHVVEAAVRSTMDAAGAPTVDDYAPMLRDARELDRLIDAVAVPESSFFRDPGSFEYLREFVSREWKNSGVLRVLSIPCAAGEEPYSIAMTLLDAGLAPSRFSIDAVDIREGALAAARAGVFRPSAFRNDAALAARERYFSSFQLSNAVRGLVRFQRGNLLDPSLFAGETFDIVFCKNLLIYFTEDARCRAVAQLQRWITPAGRLFAGASEIVWLQSAAGFMGVGGSAAMALRRRVARKTSRRLTGARASSPARIVPGRMPGAPARTLADARALAGIGKLAESAEIATAWLHTNGPSDEVYVILGLVAFARRNDSEGRTFMERALYLNPNNVEALTFMALERERDGDGATAALLRERARRAEASHA